MTEKNKEECIPCEILSVACSILPKDLQELCKKMADIAGKNPILAEKLRTDFLSKLGKDLSQKFSEIVEKEARKRGLIK